MTIDDQDCAADLQADLERIQNELDAQCRENVRLRAAIVSIGDFVNEMLNSDNAFPSVALRDVVFRCAAALDEQSNTEK